MWRYLCVMTTSSDPVPGRSDIGGTAKPSKIDIEHELPSAG